MNILAFALGWFELLIGLGILVFLFLIVVPILSRNVGGKANPDDNDPEIIPCPYCNHPTSIHAHKCPNCNGSMD